MYDQNAPYHRSAPYATGAYDPATGKSYEATYQPVEQKGAPSKNAGWGRGAGAGAVGLGLLFVKFKGLLYLLLSFKWLLLGKGLLLSGGSFFISVWFYALFFGWKFALVFVLLILVHELGHTVFMRAYGVPSTLPYFIPGFGAFVSAKARPASPLHSSYIALGGPLVGGLAAALCYAYGDATHNSFWIACAYTGFFLNLFNLFPVPPLDGGTVVASISPRIWIFGMIAFIVAAFAFHIFNPILFILMILAIPTAIAAWRTRRDPQTSPLGIGSRIGVAVAYFALIAFLTTAMLASRVAVPHA